jgi:hypothetical protein
MLFVLWLSRKGMNDMDFAIVLTAIGGISTVVGITLTIINFALSRSDKKTKDVKDDATKLSEELIEMATFRINLTNVQEDVKEIKSDMKELKGLIYKYKEIVREVANEVVSDMINVEIEKHIAKYHSDK